jgi:hypothetical protein
MTTSPATSSNSMIWSLMGVGFFGILLAAIIPMIREDAKSISPTQVSLLIGFGCVIVLIGTFIVYHRKTTGIRARKHGPVSSTTSTPPKNIWEAGKSQGSAQEEKAYSDKPFGSKYYYAHNNPDSTGGYKDGLKMEDYRMNGPRLLSKNGMTVQEEKDDQQRHDANQSSAADSVTATTSSRSIVPSDDNVRIITRYLWDDPGDSSGIATIRIDVLPDKRPGEFIEWKDVALENVSASLAGEGLVVKIITAEVQNDKRATTPLSYRLKIAKLFGDAADVKCIVKPKRLLVKIYKKKNSFLSSLGGKSGSNNLDAWPQPHRTI